MLIINDLASHLWPERCRGGAGSGTPMRPRRQLGFLCPMCPRPTIPTSRDAGARAVEGTMFEVCEKGDVLVVDAPQRAPYKAGSLGL
jgi:hypothetical protein